MCVIVRSPPPEVSGSPDKGACEWPSVTVCSPICSAATANSWEVPSGPRAAPPLKPSERLKPGAEIKKKWRFNCTSVRRPGSPAVHLNPSVTCKSKQSMNSLFRRELAPIKIPLSINSSGLPSNTHLLCKRVFPRMCAALFYFFNSSSSLTL